MCVLYIVCASNRILLSRLIALAVSNHFDSISNSSGRLVPHSKNLDWPNGLSRKTSGRLGKRKWAVVEGKRARRRADKDNRQQVYSFWQSQGRPSNFLAVFFIPFQARLALFFALCRPLPTDTLCGQSQTKHQRSLFFLLSTALLLFHPQKVERCCRSIAKDFLLFVHFRKRGGKRGRSRSHEIAFSPVAVASFERIITI